jgi:hypothetical protein
MPFGAAEQRVEIVTDVIACHPLDDATRLLNIPFDELQSRPGGRRTRFARRITLGGTSRTMAGDGPRPATVCRAA